MTNEEWRIKEFYRFKSEIRILKSEIEWGFDYVEYVHAVF